MMLVGLMRGKLIKGHWLDELSDEDFLLWWCKDEGLRDKMIIMIKGLMLGIHEILLLQFDNWVVPVQTLPEETCLDCTLLNLGQIGVALRRNSDTYKYLCTGYLIFLSLTGRCSASHDKYSWSSSIDLAQHLVFLSLKGTT